MSRVVRGIRISYPSGECWGISLEDDIGEFPVLPGLEWGTRLLIIGESLTEEVEDVLNQVPQQAKDFVRALRSNDRVGPCITLQRNSFSVGIKNYRKTSEEDRTRFWKEIKDAFQAAYNVQTLQLV